MEKFLPILKKIIPEQILEKILPAYHFALAFLATVFYGFPSYKMKVVGVTGTKGKTTTSYLIYQILNYAGFKTGLATTAIFGIGGKEWPNETKQTMLGRFGLQKLLAQMAKEGCRYAVIETSSEGILQYRHRFIDYDVAVFTNLTPEHLERHVGFENYRLAKLKLFEQVAKKKNSTGIYNLDDENIGYFLKPKIKRQFTYTLKITNYKLQITNLNVVSKIKISASGTSFLFNKDEIKMPPIGEFNVYNAAGAICATLSQGIPMKVIKNALLKVKAPPGRLEIIESKKGFRVVIDYAHEPASLEAVYKAVSSIKYQVSKDKKTKLICLLGAQGGGRDKWKRAEMGKIAARYCDKIILTNEDSYDEPPIEIINDIASGISVNQRTHQRQSASIYKIIDRKEAIKKAISLAKKGDAVILTGKGGEVWMCVENGRKIPWNEREITEEILRLQPGKSVLK